MKNLKTAYRIKKSEIKKRLEDFKSLCNAKDEDIFQELCFCILTPQSKAIRCDEAIRRLKKSGLLFDGRINSIKSALKGLVRFHNNKAAYIIAARECFKNGKRCMDIKSKIDKDNPFKAREWLVNNIKGLGYKEASHFLRNIGLGDNMAILDVHILKNLKRYGVINKIPTTNKKRYLELEEKMRQFSKRIKIPLPDLDLLFWSNQTGFIFK